MHYVVKTGRESRGGETLRDDVKVFEMLGDAEKRFFAIKDIMDGQRPAPRKVVVVSCALYRTTARDIAGAVELVRAGGGELLRSDENPFPEIPPISADELDMLLPPQT
jgi:hypothetical protein